MFLQCSSTAKIISWPFKNSVRIFLHSFVLGFISLILVQINSYLENCKTGEYMICNIHETWIDRCVCTENNKCLKCCSQKGRGESFGNFILSQPCWLCFGSGIAVCGVFSTSQISPAHLWLSSLIEISFFSFKKYLSASRAVWGIRFQKLFSLASAVHQYIPSGITKKSGHQNSQNNLIAPCKKKKCRE